MKKIIFALIISFSSFAQETVKLYPKLPVGSENWTWKETSTYDSTEKKIFVYNISEPSLSIYLPEKNIATGTAVLIVPGGGFHFLSIDNEGTEVANFLVSKGIAAFVLKHRLIHCLTNKPNDEFSDKYKNHPDVLKTEVTELVPLAIADAQTALKYINDNSKKFDLIPNQIGMMGFSAGGTITLAAEYTSPEAIRPKFLATIYPYVDATESIKNIPKAKTPLFVAVAADDQLGFVPANLKLFTDWRAANQDAEIHVYQKGGHGFGIRKNNSTSEDWSEELISWMKLNGFTKKKYPADWEKKFTPYELDEISKKNKENALKDYANLAKYQTANGKLTKEEKLKTKVVFIGDSITEGWVNTDNQYFKTNNYIGRGISGQTSPQNLLRFRQDVIELMPEAVLINIGTNDIAENTGPYNEQYTLANIQSMVEIAKANNIKVILASVLPAAEFPWRKSIQKVPEKIMALNANLEKLSILLNVPYLDYFSTLKDKNNGLSKIMAEDGVHPTLKCYKIMEKLADTTIKKVVK